MYKERAALEKDYATKMALLAKKASDRKNKRMASLVVGDDPATAWGDDTIRQRCVRNPPPGVVRQLESKRVPNGVSATRDAIRNAGHV